MKNLTKGKVLTITLLFIAVLSAIYFFIGKQPSHNGGDTTISTTPVISYSIINTYPHNTTSFTQGLQIYNGALYEGTGQYGDSKLMKVDLQTGQVEKSVSLDKQYFGEGITILRDTVYQLTWREQKVFVYTLPDFKKVKEFDIKTEGWGITTDGSQLIVSDGTSNLYYYEPSTFSLIKQQTITENGGLSYNLNELEFINGYIYANQYEMPYIVKIDPQDGSVISKIDLGGLWQRVNNQNKEGVPNGIAYDEATGKIFITGKYWPELYEIQLGQ